jgi:hypothetical protein
MALQLPAAVAVAVVVAPGRELPEPPTVPAHARMH